MKTVVGLCWLIGGALAAAASCSIEHATDDIACSTQAECDSSRTCVDGFCVVTTGMTGCPAGCTTCDTTARTCAMSPTGNNRVTCPTGWSCTITCGNNACRDVECEGSAACTVTCSGQNSCDSVTCGTGRCQVTCSGQNSCGDIDCRDSCACDVTCSGPGSCDTARCPDQCSMGMGWSSQTCASSC